MTAGEAINDVMTLGMVIELLTVFLDQHCDAVIIIGREQHGLPLSGSHGECELAELFRPVPEDASFMRTHARSLR